MTKNKNTETACKIVAAFLKKNPDVLLARGPYGMISCDENGYYGKGCLLTVYAIAIGKKVDQMGWMYSEWLQFVSGWDGLPQRGACTETETRAYMAGKQAFDYFRKRNLLI